MCVCTSDCLYPSRQQHTGHQWNCQMIQGREGKRRLPQRPCLVWPKWKAAATALSNSRATLHPSSYDAKTSWNRWDDRQVPFQHHAMIYLTVHLLFGRGRGEVKTWKLKSGMWKQKLVEVSNVYSDYSPAVWSDMQHDISWGISVIHWKPIHSACLWCTSLSSGELLLEKCAIELCCLQWELITTYFTVATHPAHTHKDKDKKIHQISCNLNIQSVQVFLTHILLVYFFKLFVNLWFYLNHVLQKPAF